MVGRRPALEAVRAGLATEVLLARGVRPTQGLREVLAAAEAADVPVRRVPAARIEAMAFGARHQGVAATVRRPALLSEADLERRAWAEDALVLVLDGVTDPQNLGAAARTAEAAGASAMVVRRRRGSHLSGAAVRASAGALLHLPVAPVVNIARAIGRLGEAGFWIVGLDGDADQGILEATPPPGRLALVAGSEGTGLSRLVREACDELVAIPLRGRVRSLNVSAAVAVALYHFALRRPP